MGFHQLQPKIAPFAFMNKASISSYWNNRTLHSYSIIIINKFIIDLLMGSHFDIQRFSGVEDILQHNLD